MKSLFLKIFYISLVSVYLFTTVGVCVIAHYCGGELEEISIITDSSSCCDDEENTDDCCENDSKHVSFQASFFIDKAVSEIKTSITKLFIIVLSSIHYAFQYLGEDITLNHLITHPPNLIQNHIVDISVLRI
ncbi:MAG: hypothetical protein IT237_07155 [Bacteroidia bacterium]|nr:hypothetical protein [Bacteroidia bacterium]